MRIATTAMRGTKTIVSSIVMLAFCPALPAAGVDTSDWKCEFCPFASEYEAEYDVGADYVSDDDLRFGNASGYDEAGGYLNFGGEGHYEQDDYQLNWYAEDLGLDSRAVSFDLGPQGYFGFELGYSELPYRLFGTTSTVFEATAGDTLVLPAGWVPSAQTSGFDALATSLQRRDIGSDRQTLTFGAHVEALPDFEMYLDYRHQERDGVDIVSGANFVQGSLLPRPLDFETDLFDLGIRYAKGPLNLSLAWSGSFFDNNADSLTWDNPFTPFTGAEQGRLAQEPDNEFRQLALSGSVALDPFDTVVAFSAALGEGEQNEAFLPYTINPSIAAGELPRSSLGGTVDTANYAFTVTSKPHPKVRLKLSYRLDERDNQTPRSEWSRVIVDGIPSGESELNTPYSYEKTRVALSGSYRLFDRLRLSAGFDRTEMDRDFQEVAGQTEDGGWGRVRWRATDWLDVNARGGSSKREIDRYDTAVAASLGQNPLLRKYHLAYRYREFGELMVAASPPKLPVTIGVSALWADDRYSQSRIGLTDSETTHWNVDLNWAASDRISVYLFGGEEEIDAAQAGSNLFSVPDWFATHDDDFRTIGGGIRIGRIGDKTDLALDYTRTDGETEISLARNVVSQSEFPDLDSSLGTLRLLLSHRRSEKLNVELSLLYESLETSDWALAGVEPGTIPTVLTLGADPYDYSVWVLGLGFRYLIGERETP